MTTYGLTETGFVPKTAEIARADINQRIRDAHGASLDLSDSDPLGFLVGLVALEIGETWEVTEAINSARSRAGASFAALDDIGQLTGTFRPEAEPSTAPLTLTGDDTTVVTSGSQVATESTGALFATLANATLAAATAWAGATAYVVGDIRTNASRIYICITAGTSAGSGGPTTTADDITDNTAHWRYVGEGTAYAQVNAECTEDGPTVALSGDITDIQTPIAGWSSAINLLDAVPGVLEASDEEYRMIQERDLTAPGSAAPDPLRQALLQVDGVTYVKITVNNTDATVDLVPPHSIEVIILGGTDADVAQAIYANKAAGIGTYSYSNDFADIVNTQGDTVRVYFTRPVEILIYAELDVYYPTGETPADAAAQVQTAIVARGDSLGVGRDPRAFDVTSAVGELDGPYDIANVLVDDVDPPVTTTVSVDNRSISAWDSSRITVNLFEGTP